LPWLFFIGDSALLSAPTVGIGGSRDASEIALYTTRQVAGALARNGKTIVSGGARGVDTAAHEAAIHEQGRTVIVLAQGIATWPVSTPLADAIGGGTATVVSEFLPYAPWSGYRAMQRNHTVLALCDSFFIPQSGLRGGTFEAGLAALKMNKPTFVATYLGENNGLYEGNQALIQRGARSLPIDASSGFVAEADGLELFDGRTIERQEQLQLF
jgi:predicted Rossmann fold nucleotide-binding protein DprA/Smf involved in DNA uptake